MGGEPAPVSGTFVCLAVAAGLVLLLLAYLCFDGGEFLLERALALGGAWLVAVAVCSIHYRGLSLGKVIAIAYAILMLVLSVGLYVFLSVGWVVG